MATITAPFEEVLAWLARHGRRACRTRRARRRPRPADRLGGVPRADRAGARARGRRRHGRREPPRAGPVRLAAIVPRTRIRARSAASRASASRSPGRAVRLRRRRRLRPLRLARRGARVRAGRAGAVPRRAAACPTRPSPTCTTCRGSALADAERACVRSAHRPARPPAAVRLPGLDRALPLLRRRPREPVARRWPAPRHRGSRGSARGRAGRRRGRAVRRRDRARGRLAARCPARSRGLLGLGCGRSDPGGAARSLWPATGRRSSPTRGRCS